MLVKFLNDLLEKNELNQNIIFKIKNRDILLMTSKSDNEWMKFLNEYIKNFISSDNNQQLTLEYCIMLIVYQNYHIMRLKLLSN